MLEKLKISINNQELSLEDFDSDDDNAENNCNMKPQLLVESKILPDEQYILHASGTRDKNFNLAIGTSSNVCEIYHLDDNRLAKSETIEHLNTIVGVQFSCENNNLIYVGCENGSITLWDSRSAKQAVAEFNDISKDKSANTRSIVCFDISPNNRLLAAGTELYEGEVFVLFWDVRKTELLGGYWESHTDDITQIKFHPTDVNKLASGSTDGLINIYDIKQSTEDDALIDSLNTESSVEQLLWYRNKNKDCLACITHTVDMQLWKTEEVQPYAHFSRSDITTAINRKTAEYCYVVGAHKCMNDEMYILAGSNWNNGECVGGIVIKNDKLGQIYRLKENKQRIRSSWFSEYHNMLVTGGESGILNVWKLKD